MLIHLNDTHRWPRENIAQWLKDFVEKPESGVEEEELVFA
jgi:hypothetical protein